MSTVSLLDATTCVSTSGLTTYTFAGAAFGAPASDRMILLTIETRRVATSIVINSVTIGGVTATPVVSGSRTDGGVTNLGAQYIAHVPTGTSGTVEITLAAAPARLSAQLVGLTGIGTSGTPYAVADDVSLSSGDPSVTIAVPAGGALVASAVTAANTTTTWAGTDAPAELFDAVMASNTTYTGAGAVYPGGATVTATADFAAPGTSPVLVASSWAPAGGGSAVGAARHHYVQQGMAA